MKPETQENTQIQIPAWMKKEENYQPETDREGFLRKTTLSLFSVLSRFHHNIAAVSLFSTWTKLAAGLAVIVMTACARNVMFVYLVSAVVLAVMVFLPLKVLRAVFLPAASAALFSALLCLPSILSGSFYSLIFIPLRVFISVCVVNLISTTSPWNEITRSLKIFHLPDVVILTFDLTLKFIAVSGKRCMDLLNALKLRSIGKNHGKADALGGISGTTFLRAKENGEEVYQAMQCRGFDGTYRRSSLSVHAYDMILLAAVICLLCIFVYLERAV